MRSIIYLFIFLSGLWLNCACAQEVHPVIVPQSSLLQPVPLLEQEDEVRAVDQLIRATKEQLALQEELREKIVVFQQQKERFMQGEQTKRHAGLMVRTAREILETITHQHLQYLFAPDFIEELTLFSSIAGKNGIKRP